MTAVAAPPEIDRRTHESLCRRMVLIRLFEDLTEQLFEQGRVHGTAHLYSGQEAVAVGMASMLGPDDRVAGTCRTIATAMKGVHDSLAAAERLAGHGIEAEVIDLRTLKPLDGETILASLRRTNRLLVVEEGPRTGGWAGEVMAAFVEDGLDDLDDAWRLCTPDHPIPYAPTLEDAFLPGPDAIVRSVLERPPFGRRA